MLYTFQMKFSLALKGGDVSGPNFSLTHILLCEKENLDLTYSSVTTNSNWLEVI